MPDRKLFLWIHNHSDLSVKWTLCREWFKILWTTYCHISNDCSTKVICGSCARLQVQKQNVNSNVSLVQRVSCSVSSVVLASLYFLRFKNKIWAGFKKWSSVGFKSDLVIIKSSIMNLAKEKVENVVFIYFFIMAQDSKIMLFICTYRKV